MFLKKSRSANQIVVHLAIYKKVLRKDSSSLPGGKESTGASRDTLKVTNHVFVPQEAPVDSFPLGMLTVSLLNS